MYEVVIPARNEELTIGPIVKTFKEHPEIGRVTVVIDTETADETPDIALANGAEIIYGTRGKGQNVTVGLLRVKTKYVILCDGDLRNLLPAHIDTMTQVNPEAQPFVIGVPDFPAIDVIMSPAVQERPEWLEGIVRSWRWVSGERLVPTELVRGIDLHGYLMEVQINDACLRAGIQAEFRQLKGLYSKFSMSKKRMEEMARDRMWGENHGWLPPT